ncbi:hypothetical protein [uncultured Microscilla sp.]|uniref:hypothetical protein n=1 Tax=uncultured Microscilla sp. TaxID=432653 RepID=UPI002616DC66|nr:hypothetical protein [uncultured Microscilla sp.]
MKTLIIKYPQVVIEEKVVMVSDNTYHKWKYEEISEADLIEGNLSDTEKCRLYGANMIADMLECGAASIKEVGVHCLRCKEEKEKLYAGTCKECLQDYPEEKMILIHELKLAIESSNEGCKRELEALKELTEL